jgi:HSP20 family molecular chaperone IbpA
MNKLANWNSLREMEEFQNRIPSAFRPASDSRENDREPLTQAEWLPPVDISGDAKEHTITAEMPKVKKGDGRVSVENGAPAITGEREFGKEGRNRKSPLKTQTIKTMTRSISVALWLGGLALSGQSLQAADEAVNPTTTTYGSGKTYKTFVERKSAGELSAEDLHQASLLGSQLLMHLNAAAAHCLDGKGDSAKPEIEKAQSLAGIIRSLLPTTTVVTVVKDANGKEAYRDEQKIQDDQIPIFSGAIAIEVVEPLVEAKKDQASLKGLKLADADVIRTAVLADLNYIERKLTRAAQLLNKPEEAAAQLALAQNVGIRFSTHKEDSPLIAVQHALRLAERMVQEKKYEGAKENLQLARLRLETYRSLIGPDEGKAAADLEKEIEKVSGDLAKAGSTEKIRGMWDRVTSWFKSEPGQARDTTATPKKEAKP